MCRVKGVQGLGCLGFGVFRFRGKSISGLGRFWFRVFGIRVFKSLHSGSS